MNRVYFNQKDSRWKNHPYTSKTFPKATIGSGGCGPTSAAMIISSMLQTIYPNQMGDIFKANGLRGDTGTYASAFEWLAKKYGLKFKKTIYINEAVECLKKGGMCVALMKAGGLFSTGGHYIVLSEIRGNNLVVFDSNLYSGKFNTGNRKKVKVNGIEAIISVYNFKKYNDYTIYCYDGPINIPSKYKAGEAVEIDVPVQITGARTKSLIDDKEDIMVDDGRGKSESQYWVHETVVNSQSHIHARATICFASGKDYMVQVFNRQFWIVEEAIVKKL